MLRETIPKVYKEMLGLYYGELIGNMQNFDTMTHYNNIAVRIPL